MKKYLTPFVIIALLLASILTYQFSKDSIQLPVSNKEEAPVNLDVYNFQDWREFSSPNGAFKVMFPALPQHATENITVPGKNMKRHYDMYVSERVDGTIFMITRITFQDPSEIKEPEKLMRATMNDMIASNPSNVLQEVNTGKYNGHDSLDFSYGNTETKIDTKLFIVDDTLYVLTRLVRTEHYNANEFNFFLNSFELNSK